MQPQQNTMVELFKAVTANSNEQTSSEIISKAAENWQYLVQGTPHLIKKIPYMGQDEKFKRIMTNSYGLSECTCRNSFIRSECYGLEDVDWRNFTEDLLLEYVEYSPLLKEQQDLRISIWGAGGLLNAAVLTAKFTAAYPNKNITFDLVECGSLFKFRYLCQLLTDSNFNVKLEASNFHEQEQLWFNENYVALQIERNKLYQHADAAMNVGFRLCETIEDYTTEMELAIENKPDIIYSFDITAKMHESGVIDSRDYIDRIAEKLRLESICIDVRPPHPRYVGDEEVEKYSVWEGGKVFRNMTALTEYNRRSLMEEIGRNYVASGFLDNSQFAAKLLKKAPYIIAENERKNRFNF